MKPLSSITLCAAAFLAASCTVFAPRFDPFVSQKTTAANSELSEFLSAVELRKYEQEESYPEALDKYASIDGKLAAAQTRSKSLPAPTQASQEARDLLGRIIGTCRTQVRELAEEHKEDGLRPQPDRLAGIRVSCDQAMQAADAMR